MELTRSLVETKAAQYRDSQPLSTVETEHIEILPGMLTEGDFGWRDVEWVVQWYFRRYLGAYPNRKRRAVEDAFGENTYEEVMQTLSSVSEMTDPRAKLEALQTLDGVDVRVGSAFLFFMFPETYVPVGDREWEALSVAGHLSEPYPDSLSVEEYLTYYDACVELMDAFEVDPWTLYRALWQLGSERAEN